MISKRRHYAVIATELYRVLIFVGLLWHLALGSYPQRWGLTAMLYVFGGMVAYVIIATLVEYARSIKWAIKNHIPVTEVIYNRFVARRAKRREIRQPKPIKGMLGYMEAWLLPVTLGMSLFILVVSLPFFSLSAEPDAKIAALVIELLMIVGLAWIARIIYRRRLEAKRLGISLTDSMSVMMQGRSIRNQERATRPSSMTVRQKYIWNGIAFFTGVAVIISGVLPDVSFSPRQVPLRDLLIFCVWLFTAQRPLALLSLNAYDE